MKKLILGIVIVLAVGGAWWYLHARNSEEADHEAEGPIASVTTAPIAVGTRLRTRSLYGTVVPSPEGIRALTVSVECVIGRLFVRAGQPVKKGDPLVEIAPSPDAALAYAQSEIAESQAAQTLKHQRAAYDLRFITKDLLLAAEGNQRDATARLDNLRRRGLVARRILFAEAGAVVGKVAVKEAEVVVAGTPLLEWVDPRHLEVRLGLEPEDAAGIPFGETLPLARVSMSGSAGGYGVVRKLSDVIDPTTRLRELIVDLPPGSGFLVDEFVSAEIPVASAEGFVVPRNALLPEGEEFAIFIVSGGKARRHVVRVALENDSEAVVAGEGIHAGDPVILRGNYELEDGMTVQTAP